MRRILDQAAHAAIKTRGSIFEVKFQHFIKHMEYKEAVWAVAHFLCKIVWKILHDGVRYEERGPAVSAAVKRKRASRLIRELKALGYTLPHPKNNCNTARSAGRFSTLLYVYFSTTALAFARTFRFTTFAAAFCSGSGWVTSSSP